MLLRYFAICSVAFLLAKFSYAEVCEFNYGGKSYVARVSGDSLSIGRVSYDEWSRNNSKETKVVEMEMKKVGPMQSRIFESSDDVPFIPNLRIEFKNDPIWGAVMYVNGERFGCKCK
jgi:hypothetical protein